MRLPPALEPMSGNRFTRAELHELVWTDPIERIGGRPVLEIYAPTDVDGTQR